MNRHSKVVFVGCAKLVLGIAIMLTFIAVAVAVVTAYERQIPQWLKNPVVGTAIMVVTFFLLVEVLTRILSPGSSTPFGLLSPRRPSRAELKETRYQTKRCFEVKEPNEETGPHYFLDVQQKGVLYLHGQYLYDYCAIDDDPELNQPQQFPCTDFALLHNKYGMLTGIECGGSLLEPEVVAPPFSKEDWKADRIPMDGDLITSKTYEELKADRMAGGTARA